MLQLDQNLYEVASEYSNPHVFTNNAFEFFIVIIVNTKKGSLYVFSNAYWLGCANKDLDGFFGPLCKFIDYCRIVALLPVIQFGIMCKYTRDRYVLSR